MDSRLLRGWRRGDCSGDGQFYPLVLEAHKIEVADSSLVYDRDTKVPMYARSGIPEVWLVNLIDAEIVIYREPSVTGYQSVQVLRRGDMIAPLAFPDVVIAVSDLLI